jgi:hypothetical protein
LKSLFLFVGLRLSRCARLSGKAGEPVAPLA